MAEQYDWSIHQGDTETLTITYASNMTGYEARAQVRDTFESTTAVVSVTSSPAAGIVLSHGSTASTAVITLSSTVTGAITSPYQGVWDFEFYNSASPSVVITPVKGGFFVGPQVTR